MFLCEYFSQPSEIAPTSPSIQLRLILSESEERLSTDHISLRIPHGVENEVVQVEHSADLDGDWIVDH